MKKQYLLMAAFASAMAFTACTNDDDAFVPGDNNTTTVNEGQVIEIAISNTGTGTTKAVRPIGSSAADNNVNKVQLKFYTKQDGTWKAVSLVDDKANATGGSLYLSTVDAVTYGTTINDEGVITYNNAEVTEGPSTPDRETKKAKIKVTGLQASTQYKIVAYGYNGDAFPYGPLTDNQGVFKPSNNVTASLEEVFADSYLALTTEAVEVPGSDPVTTEVKFNVAPKLVLERQVAGLLAYFEYVPAEIDGKIVKTIEVRANNEAQNFSFPAKDLTTPTFNGSSMTDVENVLLTFDMSKIALNYSADNAPTEGYYTFETVTSGTASETEGTTNSGAKGKKPYADEYTGATGLTLKANTIFGACYILPYNKHYDQQTLTIAFLDAEGNDLLVRDVTTDQKPNDGTIYAYDIRCNNFYSIGKKLSTEDTDGEDDDDDDDDEPIDFRSDNIVLVINDAWDVLHNMGVEE